MAGDGIVVKHQRPTDLSRTRCDWQDCIPPVQRKAAHWVTAPGTLIDSNYSSGCEGAFFARAVAIVMARVLALAPTTGLGAMLWPWRLGRTAHRLPVG